MSLPAARWFSAALLFVVTGASAVDDEQDAQAWLKSMTHAVRTQAYEGVFVYRSGGQLQSMRILHRVHEGAEQEHLYALSGTPRRVIRDGEKVTCVFPDVQAVLVDHHRSRNPLSEVIPMDVDALAGIYTVRVSGAGRIAGREAIRIGIEPRDRFRYGYHLWIDTDSRLLLRADLIDGGDEAVEQIMFTEIHVRESLPTEAFEQTGNREGFTWHRDERRPRPVEDESRWRVAELPPGFELKAREWRTSPRSGGEAEHHLYSDGLASVSVYIEPATGRDGFAGSSSMGAVNAFGRVVDGHQAVVVGEVPVDTVRAIGRSIEPRSTR